MADMNAALMHQQALRFKKKLKKIKRFIENYVFVSKTKEKLRTRACVSNDQVFDCVSVYIFAGKCCTLRSSRKNSGEHFACEGTATAFVKEANGTRAQYDERRHKKCFDLSVC